MLRGEDPPVIHQVVEESVIRALVAVNCERLKTNLGDRTIDADLGVTIALEEERMDVSSEQIHPCRCQTEDNRDRKVCQGHRVDKIPERHDLGRV